ncbi:MAG: lmo0937 family membrane protein [Bacteroidia bacterium]
MRRLLYLIAVVLVIIWGVCFFIFSIGYLIHILLLFAVVIVIIRLIDASHHQQK